MGKRNKGTGVLGIIRIIILVIALGVFGYSGYQLFSMYREYKRSSDEYSSLADEFTRSYKAEQAVPDAASSGSESRTESTGDEAHSGTAFNPVDEMNAGRKYEDADPPLSVDWNELAKINPEIVGWIVVDGCPTINYPICRSEDNDYYLHRTFRREYLFSGAIFEDYHNAADFSDPNTVIYGHNMKDGSMFNTLKQLKDQAKYDADPYFWILTPKGNYRYHIYCVMTTSINSEAYMLYDYQCDEFLEWEKRIQSMSEVKNDVELRMDDHSVILSTCTSNDSYRCVVVGKCVSSEQPPIVTPTPTPVEFVMPEPEEQIGEEWAGDVWNVG